MYTSLSLSIESFILIMSLSCVIALVSLKSLLLYYCKQLVQALGPLTGKDGPIQFFQINTILSMILMFLQFCGCKTTFYIADSFSLSNCPISF